MKTQLNQRSGRRWFGGAVVTFVLLALAAILSTNGAVASPRDRESGPRVPPEEPSLQKQSRNPVCTPSLDNENVELVGHLGGPTDAIALQGKYAYLGEGFRLTVIDISDPSSPVVKGKTAMLPDVVRDVAVTGEFAYVADGRAGLRVINIADPSAPVEVSSYNTPGSACAVVVSGDHAYIADGNEGLRIVEISDPTDLTEIGSLDTSGEATDLVLVGSFIYLTDGDNGLRIVKVSDPSSLAEVGAYDTEGYASSVAVAKSYAYVADGDAGLRIISVSNPAKPNEIGHYSTLHAESVAISGQYAYVVDSDEFMWDQRGSGLRIIKVSDHAGPLEVGFSPTIRDGTKVAIGGNYAYVAAGGLSIITISKPASPSEVALYKVLGDSLKVAMVDQYAYVTDWSTGLHIIDGKVPTVPNEARVIELPGAGNISVSDDVGYVTAGSYFYTLNVGDPLNPITLGTFEEGESVDVDITGQMAYVADGGYGLRIFDVSDPAARKLLGTADAHCWAYAVAVADGYAYVPNDACQAMVVFDVTDPGAPSEVAYFETLGYGLGIAIDDHYAFLASGYGGLDIVDITDPTTPTRVGSFNTPGDTYDVAVSGGYAFVADGNGGLRVLDITDPEAPKEMGYYETAGFATGVVIDGDYVYVTDAYSGLFIFRYTPPPADLTIVKTVSGLNEDYGWSFGFTGDLGQFTLDKADQDIRFEQLYPGEYTISETDVPGYRVSVSCDNRQGSDDGNLTVKLTGQDVTCTFTNTAQPSSISIVKRVVGIEPPWAFAFGGDLGTFGLTHMKLSKTFTNLMAGDYTVIEGQSADSIVGVACDSGESGLSFATIDLEPGEDTTCIFTNTDIAKTRIFLPEILR